MRLVGRLPLRARVTVGFTVAMAVLLAAAALALRSLMAGALLDELDTGLRARAATIQQALPNRPELTEPAARLVEGHEAFAQVLDATGAVLASSIGASALVEATGSSPSHYLVRSVVGVEDKARILVTPARRGGETFVVVVGSSMADRRDALRLLDGSFLLGGPLTLLVASWLGWLAAGRALRSVERLRVQAAAITMAGPDQRLTVPSPRDELKELALTLNEMIDRLDRSLQAERRFLDRASHELRTPLAALRAELDLARRGPRTERELRAALDSASVETDRLARLAADLLVLSRSRSGRLPVRPEPIRVDDLLRHCATRFVAAAAERDVTIAVEAGEIDGHLDPARIRQAIDDLVDNALRFAESAVVLGAQLDKDGAGVRITVEDDGPGFAAEPPEGTSGLGLTIVRAIAEAHRGMLIIDSTPRGARAALVLPQAP